MRRLLLALYGRIIGRIMPSDEALATITADLYSMFVTEWEECVQ